MGASGRAKVKNLKESVFGGWVLSSGCLAFFSGARRELKEIPPLPPLAGASPLLAPANYRHRCPRAVVGQLVVVLTRTLKCLSYRRRGVTF